MLESSFLIELICWVLFFIYCLRVYTFCWISCGLVGIMIFYYIFSSIYLGCYGDFCLYFSFYFYCFVCFKSDSLLLLSDDNPPLILDICSTAWLETNTKSLISLTYCANLSSSLAKVGTLFCDSNCLCYFTYLDKGYVY